MTSNLNSLAEARRAAASPLFANLDGDIGVSFEFFPPKTEKMEAQLWDTFRTPGRWVGPLLRALATSIGYFVVIGILSLAIGIVIAVAGKLLG